MVGAIVVLALASSLAGLFNDFVYDDIPLLRDSERLHSLGHWREILTHAYWPPPFVEQLYRPLSSLWLAAQYGFGAGSPIVFRLVSYALYAGRLLASRIAGDAKDDPIPATATPLPRFPLAGLRRTGQRAAYAWYRFQDNRG